MGEFSGSWEQLTASCIHCRRCELCATRTNVVVGVGNKESKVMFVGEGPGYHEDKQGLPFVGPAGHLLDKMLAAIEWERSQVYITNIVKCRPPGNRDPLPAEMEACLPFLRYQFSLLKPKILVCLGRISAKAIIDKDLKITRDRGIWHEKKGCHMMATFHPSALLRDESKKRPAWEDMQSLKEKYIEIMK